MAARAKKPGARFYWCVGPLSLPLPALVDDINTPQAAPWLCAPVVALRRRPRSRHHLTPATAAPVCSLDASACALLSEDFSGTTRWHFQRELVACHSRVCLSGAQPPVALLAGSDGRAGVLLHPTAETGALQQALDGARPAGEGNLASSLKLALVRGQSLG